MTETTGEEAKTLHRLLEIGKIEEERTSKYNDFDVAPLDADVIIVDEMSMVDLFLMNYLVKAIYQGSKLVLVGDVDQLPSVGPGNVLADLINSKRIKTIVLNKIFRQAAKSKIIINSHRVNSGETFIKPQESAEELNQDFFYIKENNQDKILNQILSLCSGRLESYGNYEFFKSIQVITPTKKGMLGTKELNKVLQECLNPLPEGGLERQNLGASFRSGDRVMQIKNNYDIFWEREKYGYETGNGVFNGEFGTILKLDDIEKRVKIKFNTRVVGIETKENKVVSVMYEDENGGQKKILADKVILATGGKTYSATGSTGDGYEIAQKLGHTIVPVKPSLVPLTVEGESLNICKQMQGLSLRNVGISLIDKENNKTIYEDFGEMLFTHFGVSGPVILSASSVITGIVKERPVRLSIDLKPAITDEQLDERILRDFDEEKNKSFKNSLDKLLPKKLIPIVVMLSGIDGNKKVNEITRAERQGLVKLLKEFELTLTGLRGFNEAIITQGGVNVKEINPTTMESKLVKHLLFAGEVLDVDAVTGGFNLQIAWSTGYAAGSHLE